MMRQLPGLADIPDDFGYTDEVDLVRKSAQRLMAERCPMHVVRALDRDERGWDRSLWDEMAALGWLGLALPEACGGAALGTVALATALEQTGRACLPGPLFSSSLAALALVDAGAVDACAPLATGSRIATLGLTEPDASWHPEDTRATAEKSGPDYVLNGVKTHVMWAADADLLVAPFHVGDDIRVFAIDLPHERVAIEPEVCVDRTRRTARVVFDDARVGPAALLPGGTLAAWRRTLTRGRALLAAEMVGAAEALLVMTRDYANERIQFGRPIGSFQAVKHPIVNVMLAVEAARSHAYAAAAAIDVDVDAAEVPSRMAKAAATDALTFAADRAIQLHGGFGFTYDCDAHFYFKRGLWAAATLGDAAHHRRELASELFGD
ncbi:MAG: acyl-CoA dehydrogenase [Deltaproteobacteria bacterium]|nr:MAG: acyl-CoA dehydrogenase [Deltaproteobacteria bacterium]